MDRNIGIAELPSKQAVVEVKSAWLSKINWTQAVTGAAMVVAFFTGNQLNITGEQQAALVTTIGVIGNVATWIIKTWFTPSVTPSSVVAPTVVSPDIVATVASAPGVAKVVIMPDAHPELLKLVRDDPNVIAR